MIYEKGAWVEGPLVEGKGKSQSDGSNDAKNRKAKQDRYDVTTNRRRSDYNSHGFSIRHQE